MLHQVKQVRQESDTTNHLWFQSHYFDLFVWYESEEKIVSFQLCYDKPSMEKALTWHTSKGWTYNRVDSGEEADRTPAKSSPILLQDGTFEPDSILDQFRAEAEKLPKWISGFLLNKLRHYPGNSTETE